MGVKEQVKEVIDGLPDNCTLEDVLYQLYVLEKVQRGLESLETKPGIPHETAMKEIEEWLMKLNGQNQPSKT
jgi:hypothetical protein